MIGFAPCLIDMDNTTVKSGLKKLCKQHEEDSSVFQNIIKRGSKMSTWSKGGTVEHEGYNKKVLSMYEDVFFGIVKRIIQLENEKERSHKLQVIADDEIRIRGNRKK